MGGWLSRFYDEEEEVPQPQQIQRSRTIPYSDASAAISTPIQFSLGRESFHAAVEPHKEYAHFAIEDVYTWRDNTSHRISPLHIRYSQDAIFYKFQAKDHRAMKEIATVAEDLITGYIKVSDFPKIKVILFEGNLHSLDNRRLWVFKQYQKYKQDLEIDSDNHNVLDRPAPILHNQVRRSQQPVIRKLYQEDSPLETPNFDNARVSNDTSRSCHVDNSYLNYSPGIFLPKIHQNARTTSQYTTRNWKIVYSDIKVIADESDGSNLDSPGEFSIEQIKNWRYNNLYDISPAHLRFCQDTIFYKFQAKSHTDMKTIKSVLESLLNGECKISDFPPIQVVLKENLLYTLDNRRLWLFKQYQKQHKDIMIKVEYLELTSKHQLKFTTKNKGSSIKIERKPKHSRRQ
ncbi:DgyrCDS2554 [Dimorphilus gyrociliatus]|uniref:DgyrCDS2554 n=1 Tax=Dimorphilus gyrociliatus TaxID=2664684 RepID=A0A7I8VAM3_9ANNE|nr:DgyrCDS2554 [Dimorphilus gyrociliatus]